MRFEHAAHPVQRARHLGVRDRGAHGLAAPHALQSEPAHQPFHRATRHRHPFAIHLLPDLVGAIDLHIGLPNLLDVGNQLLIALGTGWQQRRVALPGRMQAVTAGGDLQDLADRLDPEAVTMLIDKCL